MLTCNFCGQTVLGSSAKRVKVANFNPKNNPSSMKPTVRVTELFKGYGLSIAYLFSGVSQLLQTPAAVHDLPQLRGISLG